MKTQFPSKNNRGVVLLITLVAVGVIGIGLASYLTMVQNESVYVTRSQTWNASLATAEAGIEDSLAFINQGGSWSNTATANHWTVLPNNVYYTTRYIGTNIYSVYLTNQNNAPVIKATGTVVWYGGTSGNANISRAVLVTTAFKSYYSYGILVKTTISVGGGALLDSFTGPLYLTTNQTANLVLATDATNAAGAISMNGGNLYGTAETGAGSTVSVNGSASVGNTNWVPTTGIQPGATNSTVNVYIPDASIAPATAPWLPLPLPVSGVYTLVGSPLTNYYTIPDKTTISGTKSIVITGGGVVALNCQGSFSLAGSAFILVTNNTTLVAYLNGATSLGGGGVINGTSSATNCIYYGSTNCTSLTYLGSSAFIGMIDAPYAAFKIGGTASFIGSVIADSFTDVGGAAFHYPEYLNSTNSPTLYSVTSWQEVSP